MAIDIWSKTHVSTSSHEEASLPGMPSELTLLSPRSKFAALLFGFGFKFHDDTA